MQAVAQTAAPEAGEIGVVSCFLEELGDAGKGEESVGHFAEGALGVGSDECLVGKEDEDVHGIAVV